MANLNGPREMNAEINSLPWDRGNMVLDLRVPNTGKWHLYPANKLRPPMPLELDDITDANLIRAYGPGQFTVNLKVIASSIIIMPDQLEANWAPTQIGDIDMGHIEIIINMAPEVVLLGTGKVLQFPEQSILAIFNQHAIGVEVMDTSAACRTYNLLVAEGRNVAAGLLMI